MNGQERRLILLAIALIAIIVSGAMLLYSSRNDRSPPTRTATEVYGLVPLRVGIDAPAGPRPVLNVLYGTKRWGTIDIGVPVLMDPGTITIRALVPTPQVGDGAFFVVSKTVVLKEGAPEEDVSIQIPSLQAKKRKLQWDPLTAKTTGCNNSSLTSIRNWTKDTWRQFENKASEPLYKRFTDWLSKYDDAPPSNAIIPVLTPVWPTGAGEDPSDNEEFVFLGSEQIRPLGEWFLNTKYNLTDLIAAFQVAADTASKLAQSCMDEGGRTAFSGVEGSAKAAADNLKNVNYYIQGSVQRLANVLQKNATALQLNKEIRR